MFNLYKLPFKLSNNQIFPPGALVPGQRPD